MRTKGRVREYADKHPTATVREIQTALGLSSPSVVQFHLKVDSKDNIIEAKDKRIAELEAENANMRSALDFIAAAKGGVMSTIAIKGYKIGKDGKVTKVISYRSASDAIRAKKSKRQKPVKRTP